MSNEPAAKGTRPPTRYDARVEDARAAVRALLAPTGKDLEALLMQLHEQSAQSQRKARRSQQQARDEVYRRLEGQVVEVDDTGAVVVAIVTTRELIGLIEAESNLVKAEALAQRAYHLHRMATAAERPPAGSIESMVEALEQEDPAPL